MSALYRKYNSKGFEVVFGTLNPNPRIPEFVQAFQIPFAVGVANEVFARSFMGISAITRATVPWLSVVDRGQMIRAQHLGESSIFNDKGETLSRVIEPLLAQGGAPATKRKKK